MAQRGRKPDPAGVQVAKGNPGKRGKAAAAAGERRSPSSLPARIGAMPKVLCPAAKTIWKELAPQLVALRFIRETDRGVFARYCETLAEFWRVTRKLRKKGEGLVYWTKTRHGDMKRINPLVMIQNSLERRLESLEDRLGLNPQARQNLFVRLAATPGWLPGVGDPKQHDGDGETDTGKEGPPPASPIGVLKDTSTVH